MQIRIQCYCYYRNIYIYIIYIHYYIYICIYIYILHIRMSVVCLPKHEGRTAMSVLPGPTGKRTWRGRKLKWEIQFCHIYGCWRHHASHFPSIAINSSFWSFPPPWKIIPKNTNARITQVMTSWQAFFKKKNVGNSRAWSPCAILKISTCESVFPMVFP